MEQIYKHISEHEDEQKEKYNFVCTYLSPMVAFMDTDIDTLTYVVTYRNEEFVVVNFKSVHAYGNNLRICVSADSLSALIKDVMNKLF